MRSASVGFQCPECVKEGSASVRSPQAVYGGRATTRPDVTYALIALNVVMFVLTTASGTGALSGSAPSKLFQRLALVPYGVALNHEYYRLLTSTFLHFGVIHIALNMYCLYLLGPALERTLGRLRFAALYLLSGVSGAALSYALGPVGEIAAGASGAIFGLFAAFFVIERRRGGNVGPIATTIAINLAFSFGFSGYIDWRGHVGGLIGGALVTAGLVYAPTGPRRWVYQLASGTAVLLLVVAVTAARTAALT